MTPGRRAALEAQLRDAIRTGQLTEGSRLPSSRGYADELGLSRGTVTAAFDQLVAEGYLTAHRGAGVRVAAIRKAAPRTPAELVVSPRLDLRPGSPDVSSFPVTAWLRASRKALNAAPASTFGYGDPRGRLELRTALAEYLGRARGVITTADNIVVTTSYAQALSLIAAVLVERGGGPVGMEDPGLPYHRDIVRRTGAAVVAVPVDELGLCTDALDGLAAVVATAAHQYPTGMTLGPARRLALTRWAQITGGLVVEDDYDGEFRYDRQPIGALQGTAPDHVAYVGTVAKTLGPAVRIGWTALPPSMVDQVTEAKRLADHHTDSLSQLTLAELLTSHVYDRHIRAVRLRYRRRRDLLVAALEPIPGVDVGGVSAGLQTLVRLPAGGPSEDDVVSLAAEEGLALAGLGEHWHAGAHAPGLVVGFASPSESAYPAALSALRGVLSRALA
jgi:GntR family transcriptional regulator / MocR family aminotransferase